MLSGGDIILFLVGVALQHIPLYLIPSGNDTGVAGGILIAAGFVYLLSIFILVLNGGNAGITLIVLTMVAINCINWGIAFVQGKDESGKPKYDRTVHGSVNVGVIIGLLAVLLFRRENLDKEQLRTSLAVATGNIINDCVKNFGGEETVKLLVNTVGVSSVKNTDQLPSLCNKLVEHLVGLKSKGELLTKFKSNAIRNIIKTSRIRDNALVKLLNDVSRPI